MFPNLKLAMIYCTEMEKLLNILKLEVSSKKKKNQACKGSNAGSGSNATECRITMEL
jgi:hypothetical protein